MFKTGVFAAAVALGALAPAAAGAAVIVSQASFDWTYAGFESLFLPKHGGAGTITSVTFSFTGETQQYRDVFAGDDPQTLPEEPVSWTVSLRGPGIDDGMGSTSFALLGDFLVETAFPEVELPGNPGEQVTRVTPIVPFSILASDPDLFRYAGAGTNEFVVDIGLGGSTTQFRGTLTQTITTAAIPEPAAWTVMIAGFGGVGAAMRRRRALAAA